jgi:hypothetical protein
LAGPTPSTISTILGNGIIFFTSITGWWVSTPLKNISQMMSNGIIVPNTVYGKVKNVPKHQPVKHAIKTIYNLQSFSRI